MRKFNTECVVIKSINYKDADKIYTFYSRDNGKFIATARGVRKTASKRGGSLDTLNHLNISFSENSKGYKYISEVVHKNSFTELKSDLRASAKAYYMIELLHKFTEEEEKQPELFILLVKALKLLDSKSIENDLVVTYFELNLLKELGYGLRFDKCVSCEKEFSKEWNSYGLNLSSGGLVCGECQSGLKISKADALFLNALERGKVLSNINISTETLNLIKAFIKDTLEDTLKSSQIFGHL